MTYERKVTDEQEIEIVKKYEVDLIPCRVLALEYGMTRQGVFKILKRRGVDTVRGGANCRPDVTCHHCGKVFNVNRAKLRNAQNLYCSKVCWIAHLDKIKIGKLSRNGMYNARKELCKAGVFLFGIKGRVVHHVDGDDNNNKISNLEIYETSGDHLRMHRGFDVAPIWRGIDFIKEAGHEHLS